MKDLMQTLQEEFADKIKDLDSSIIRETQFWDISNKIKVAIGMRRAGKTFFMLQKAHSLMRSGIPVSRILYVNFEDDRLSPLTSNKLSSLIDGFL